MVFGLGKSKSKTKVKKSVVTDIVTKAMQTHSVSSSASVNASQSISADGPNSNSSGNIQKMVNKINLTSLSDTKVNAEMQADISQKLLSVLTTEQESENALPLMGGNDSNQTAETAIKNGVAATFSTDVMSDMNLSISTKQNISSTGGGTANNNVQELQSTLVGEQVSKLVSNLEQSLQVSVVDVSNLSTAQKISNTLFGDMFSSIISISVLFLLGFVAPMVLIFYFFMYNPDKLDVVVDAAASATPAGAAGSALKKM